METRDVLAVAVVALLAMVAQFAVLGDPIGISALFAGPKPEATPTPASPNVSVPTPTPIPLPMVKITELVDPDCAECFDIGIVSRNFIENSQVMGLEFIVEEVGVSTQEGQALISTYNITKVPTVLLSREAGLSPPFMLAWDGYGTVEQDGVLVLRDAYPPYINLQTGELAGNVTLVNLRYEPCAVCYDVAQVEMGLKQRYGVSVFNVIEYSYDSEEWQEIVAKYNITKVPAVVVSPELSEYPGVEELWVQELGTREPDGWFVFRSMDVPDAIYYDLLLNSTVQKIY